MSVMSAITMTESNSDGGSDSNNDVISNSSCSAVQYLIFTFIIAVVMIIRWFSMILSWQLAFVQTVAFTLN